MCKLFSLDTRPRTLSTICLFLFQRSLDTFCPTTEICPQEVIISFTALMSKGNIKILSSNGEQTPFPEW